MRKNHSAKDRRLLYPEQSYIREDDERAFLREDELTADIVERGVGFKNIYGSMYATRYLRERNIGQDVINRVLSAGNIRRRI